MPASRARRPYLAPLAFAAAIISAAAAAGCADSPRDRHLRASNLVHHPATPTAPAPTIATVPTD